MTPLRFELALGAEVAQKRTGGVLGAAHICDSQFAARFVQLGEMSKQPPLGTTLTMSKGTLRQKRNEEKFYALAKRFRAAKEPETVKKLGDQLGRIVFG